MKFLLFNSAVSSTDLNMNEKLVNGVENCRSHDKEKKSSK